MRTVPRLRPPLRLDWLGGFRSDSGSIPEVDSECHGRSVGFVACLVCIIEFGSGDIKALWMRGSRLSLSGSGARLPHLLVIQRLNLWAGV